MTSHLQTLLLLASGALLAGGSVLLLRVLLPAPARLGDALALLAPDRPTPAAVRETAVATGRLDRAGAWLHRRSPLPVTPRQLRSLELRGQSVAAFFGEKLLLALVVGAMPLLLSGLALLLVDLSLAVPVLATLLGGVLGWFLPDLNLRRGEPAARRAAGESLFTLFDLVVLERLANRSATQSLQAAAQLSSTPLFLGVQAALERARLEQRPPWTDLRRTADQLDLPQLGDLADVMSLESSGAALSDTLRARVAELRDAHRAEVVVNAQQVSERMSVPMVLPALVFGLVFLVPALLRLLGLAESPL